MSLYNRENGKFVHVDEETFAGRGWDGSENIKMDIIKSLGVVVDTTFLGISMTTNHYDQPQNLFLVSVGKILPPKFAWTRDEDRFVFYGKFHTESDALRKHEELVRVYTNPQVALFPIQIVD